MRSRFFWRLYLTYFSLVVLTAAAIGVLTDRQFRTELDARIEQQLIRESAALIPASRPLLESADLEGARTAVVEVGDRTQTRITLVLPDGTVLADSSEAPENMENHGSRPEIAAALRTGLGVERRFSETTRTDRLYVALSVVAGDTTVGVVRTSVTLDDVDAQIATMRSQVAQGAALGILLALGIGLFVARRVMAPIAEMSAVSESLRLGDYTKRVQVDRTDEIGVLGKNLNQLGVELSRRVSGLGRQQAQLRAFLGAMQEGVVAIDPQNRVVFSNAMGRRLLHLDPGEHELDMSQMPGGLLDVLAEVRAMGTRARSEIVQRIDEEELILDASGAPFTVEDASGVVLVLYDITNMRRLERIRTDFVANVSHELKTPLTSIQGYVETLLDGAIHDDEYNTRFLEKTHLQVRRLTLLVADLISLARIESTSFRPESEPIDLREIIIESVAYRHDPLRDKKLDLDLDLPDEALLIDGESEGLRQVVDNLLDNAMNYTPKKGSIRVQLRSEGYDGVLRIEDTGIGIPDAALDRIFERFYRVDPGRSRELGGTGLGLSIVRNIVQRMQGTVAVESEEGDGTTFTVTLPRADQPVVIADPEPLA